MARRKKNPAELLVFGVGNPRVRAPKVLSEAQAFAKLKKAQDGIYNLGLDDPNGILGMSPKEYAEHKGFTIGQNPKPRIELTPEEKAYWEKAWLEFYESKGLTGAESDKAAWKAAQKEFPRLAKLGNPGRPLKPVSEITDRAKRYRAQKNVRGNKKRCAKCGSTKNVDIAHKDGDESNNKPSNLEPQCRRCNVKEGIRLKKAGRGVRTRQFNPGADTLGQYVAAAVEHRRGARDAGGAVIHATPADKRSKFAKQIWKLRRSHGNPDGPIEVTTGPDLKVSHKCRICGKKLKSWASAVSHVMKEHTKITRKNPPGGSWARAESLYEGFHGKSPTELQEIALSNELQKKYVYLGEFSRAEFLQDDGKIWNIDFDGDGVKLCSSPDGKSLYFIGGNQDIGPILRDRGLDMSKELISFGRLYCVYYVAAKSQTDFKLTEWQHYLGCVEEISALLVKAEAEGWTNAEFQAAVSAVFDRVPPLERDLPEVFFDSRNVRMILAGGSYYVAWPGIVG